MPMCTLLCRIMAAVLKCIHINVHNAYLQLVHCYQQCMRACVCVLRTWISSEGGDRTLAHVQNYVDP